MTASRIAGFDGLRAVSVGMVIATHAGLTRWLEHHGVLNDTTRTAFTGYTGVQVFFLLSGFIITHLMMQEHLATGRVRLGAFFLRRALRILPLYFLALLVTVATAALVYPIASKESVMFAATFTTNFIPKAWYSTSLGHTWSLAVEEHFYLIWPIVVIFAAHYRWNTLLRWLCIACIGFAGVGAVLLSSAYLMAHYKVLDWTPIAGLHIALGCAAAIIVNRPEYSFMRPAVLMSGHALLVAVCLFIAGLFVEHASNFAGSLVRSVGVALLLIWLFFNQTSLLVKVLENRVLVYIGSISYGLYIWQGYFLATGPYRAPGQTWPLTPEIGVVLLAIVAPLSYHFFEQPILSLKRRLGVISK